MRNRAKTRLTAYLAALALLLSACARDSQTASDPASITLPEPEAAQARQILGDSTSNEAREVTLYCASAGSLELTAVTRSISIGADGSFLANALEALLDATPTTGSLALSQAGAQLDGVEFSGGAVNVRLSLETGVNRDDQDALLLYASIANTLLGMDGVESVNILIGDRANSVCGLPTGAFAEPISNIAAEYAQMQAERERFPTDGISSISRNALVYFPAQDGQYLLPEARTLVFSSEDYASALIAALQAGPLTHSCCFCAVPGNLDDLLLAAPETQITEAGERVLELRFSAMLPNYLALAGVEPWQLYGSLVLTFCSFAPDTDAVRISIDGVNVTECAMPDGVRMRFEDGLMRRADFSACIGGSAMLYYAREDGTLAQVERALSQAAAISPEGILRAMISMDAPSQSELRSVFPEGIAPEDILGVRVEDRIATVNLSGNFYSLCQSLDTDAERLLIYGMVNALAELDEIGAVAFLVEGEQIDSLSQEIYLRTALMPDPGLVSETDQSTDIEGAS